MPILLETRKWSLDYFNEMYKRLNTKFDRLFFESEVAGLGMKIARKLLAKGILCESDGAVIFNGEKYGVDTRVFINSLGLPTYEAKELGVAELEFSEFGTIDNCIHVVTPEQSSFFKVTFKVQELFDPKKYKDKQIHFAYEFVDLKGGKMSSREGNVVSGEWLINEVAKKIEESFSVEAGIAEKISLGSVKYSFLKVDAKRKIKFDIDESISLHGNSGPYLLYVYARCQSILKKVENNTKYEIPNTKYETEELALLRTLFKFPEIVEDAAENYAPHLIATYIFDLAQKFNVLYEKLPILKAEEQDKQKRLLLVQATAQILKNGLYLLGIETLDKI
jgi:arginyl-tRNA synthetase